MIEHPCFIALVNYIRPNTAIPGRKTLKAALMDSYMDEKKKLKDMVAKINGCRFSFTTDIWTSPNAEPYMAITIHYINDSWGLECKLVAFRHIPGAHTGVSISKEFETCLVELGISDKVIFFYTSFIIIKR